MKVFINGEAREFANGTTVAGVLQTLGLAGKRIAVEVNEDIVPRGRHEQTVLHNNDRIEIVHAIGGG